MTKKRRRSNDYTLVLWGHNFDVAAASLFVSGLRRAKYRVKVVGTGGRNSQGDCGLALIPDLNVSQAEKIVDLVSCIIIPCNPTQWSRLNDDPRIVRLIHQVQDNTALIVTEKPTDTLIALSRKSSRFFELIEDPVTYSSNDSISFFVQYFIQLLGK